MSSWCVHAQDERLAKPHRVEADGWLDAAMAYAERWLGDADEAPVTLIVQDEASGAEHCLTVDLASGEAEACG